MCENFSVYIPSIGNFMRNRMQKSPRKSIDATSRYGQKFISPSLSPVSNFCFHSFASSLPLIMYTKFEQIPISIIIDRSNMEIGTFRKFENFEIFWTVP
jgi:hypothetical protein